MTTIIHNPDGSITVSVTINLEGSMMEMENKILDGVNEVGSLATGEALKRFDTDGSPIVREGVKLTSRNKDSKKYQTPFGITEIERHVYQTSKGGKVFCPLEDSARTIFAATPKFAQQLSHKYSQGNANSVCSDLKENHNRSIAKSTVQMVTDWVGSIACAQEEAWDYAPPECDEPISTIVFSLDGAYVLMANEGYREAMVGNLSLYDGEGERQHTLYIGEAPEYGKTCFKERFEHEIQCLKARYPDALYLGIADGAKDNWTFLEQHTKRQLVDFYHVTEYLAKAAYAVYPKKATQIKRKQWLSEHCSQLKHEKNAAQTILDELKALSVTKLSETIKADLEATITYFSNNIEKNRMNYAQYMDEKLPIGSGVTEAACKTLVKQRLCGSGMRWKNKGAKVVLSLRALVQTTNRWQQFWDKIIQFGVSHQTA
ncbi:MAG: ISKra4 family transposase [Methylococcales bacterium]|nr:ISKra4 family transposase [Methylococcales bacterium]